LLITVNISFVPFSTCGNATKDTAKGAKESRGKGNGAYGRVIRSAANRVEKEPCTGLMTKSAEALWGGHSK